MSSYTIIYLMSNKLTYGIFIAKLLNLHRLLWGGICLIGLLT